MKTSPFELIFSSSTFVVFDLFLTKNNLSLYLGNQNQALKCTSASKCRKLSKLCNTIINSVLTSLNFPTLQTSHKKLKWDCFFLLLGKCTELGNDPRKSAICQLLRSSGNLAIFDSVTVIYHTLIPFSSKLMLLYQNSTQKNKKSGKIDPNLIQN